MRKIEFKKVGMKNFRNYIEPMEIDLENGKLIVITGPNGIGKSTIFNAIPFTLYGMTPDGARGDDVVNNQTEKNCHTWVEFNINNDKYRVDRYHKYTRKGNSVELRKNDEEPYKVGQRELLPEIERLIVPRKLFMNTLLFGQGVKDFFTDLTDTQKKDIFRKVLQLDNYVSYYEEVKKRIKEISEKTTELNQSLQVAIKLLEDSKNQIKVLKIAKNEFTEFKKNEIIQLTDNIEGLKNKKIKLENELSELSVYIPQINEITSKINDQQKKMLELKHKLETFNQNTINAKNTKEHEIKKEITDKINFITSKFDNVRNEIDNTTRDKKQKELTELNKQINDINLDDNTISNEIKSIQERIFEINENVINKDISVCPTCYQTIGKKEKEELKNKVDNYMKLIKEKLDLRNKFDNQREILKEKYKIEIELLVNENKNQLENITIEKKEKEYFLKKKLNDELLILNDKLKEAIDESREYGIKKHNELQEELNNLEIENKKLDKIKTKINISENDITILSSRIEMIDESIKKKKLEKFDETQLDSYVNKKNKLKKDIDNIELERIKFAKDLEILEFWKLGFSQNGIPAMLIDESIPFLNERVSYYLDKISNGRYTVSFDTLAETKSGEFRDKISVNVLDNHTKANSRIQLSGGQTRLVDIATILTLNDLQSHVQDVSINLLLFDEIFDSLDDTNIGYVSNVIRTLTQDRFVSIISHRHIDQIEADEYLNLN